MTSRILVFDGLEHIHYSLTPLHKTNKEAAKLLRFCETGPLGVCILARPLKSGGEQLELHDKDVNERPLLFKQRLAIGRDLRHIPESSILVDSEQIHRHPFSAW